MGYKLVELVLVAFECLVEETDHSKIAVAKIAESAVVVVVVGKVAVAAQVVVVDMIAVVLVVVPDRTVVALVSVAQVVVADMFAVVLVVVPDMAVVVLVVAVVSANFGIVAADLSPPLVDIGLE